MMQVRRWFLHLAVVALAAIPGVTRLPARAAAAGPEGLPPGPRLTTVTSQTTGARTAVLIEASEPVAYVTTRPDPLTVLVDLRRVSSAGAVNTAAGTPAVESVGVEDATSPDGFPMARVTVRLRSPGLHRVRSTKNLIVVEVDGQPRAEAAPAAAPPVAASPRDAAPAAEASTLDRIRATGSPESVRIVLSGNGRLPAAKVLETGGSLPRLVLDFPGVEPAAPATTWVSLAPVEKVRVALNQRSPLLTRVVVDLTRPAVYRIEPIGDRGSEVAVTFERSAAAPSGSTAAAVAIPVRTAALPASAAPADPFSALTLDDAGAGPAVRNRTPAETVGAPAGAADGAIEPGELLPAPVVRATPPPLDSSPLRIRAARAPVTRIPVVVAEAPAATARPAAVVADPPPAAQPVTTAPPPIESAPAVPAEAMQAPAAPAAVTAAPAPMPATQEPVAAVANAQEPPPQPTGLPTGQPGGERTYTGHPISLDFQGADLRAVLRTFAEISGLNLVIDPAVTGSVDVTLRDVPWDQALDLILRANKLGYVIDGTIVRIAPLTVLADEEAQRRKLAEERALSGELLVETRQLSYARADEIRGLITQSALSARGRVEIDARTNTLIITDLPQRIDTAMQLIDTLDRPEPQVQIEARIIQTNRTFARQLGVQWGFTGRVSPELGNTTGLAFPNQGSLTGRTGVVQSAPGQGTESAATAVNLGVEGATSGVGLAVGAVNGAFNLDVALSALENAGQVRILSTPRVSTQNNVEAEITQGTQIPIQTVANNTVTVTFKDATLTLRVTPQITASNTVIMRISLENAEADFGRSVNNIPPIDTQRALTTVLVRDGETTVIAGIYESTSSTRTDRTPGLHRIPLLGWLFRRENVSDASQELLIFITPRIINS